MFTTKVPPSSRTIISPSEACAVIPAYNESSSIAFLVREILSFGISVLVVDDGSSDSTFEEARGAGARVISLGKNCGKGVALTCGLSFAKRSRYKFAVVLDGDGQHSPSDAMRLLLFLKAQDVDLVIGNRMEEVGRMPFVRRFTNRFMSAVLRILTGAKIPDTQCGLRALKLSSFDFSKMRCRRFDWESELIVRAVRDRLRIVSVPIGCFYNRGMSSKIRVVPDTFRFILLVLRSILRR
ncbi:MAG: glycosyltransferase family 2 protein [Planctomycetota bacterium]|nr:glycosyltransferase family 2 protein [Planctomycetota bacterium]